MVRQFQYAKHSIAGNALAGMALRVSLIIVIATGLSYWYAYNSFRASAMKHLTNYVEQRSRSESEHFLLAERQSALLRDEFLRRLQAMGTYDPRAEFDKIFVREADGLIRVRPEINDHRRHATAYLRHDVELTPDLRRRFYIGWQLMDQWGPMLVNRFFSGFMNMPEQLSINYCPAADWGRSATRDTDITIYETVWRATAEKNPKRTPFWTSVYYDPGAREWMVSRVTPGDYNGRWVVTGGQDVAIADLIRRTTDNTIESGSWNFIVDEQANIIAHPNLTDQIAKAGGNLQAGRLGDDKLSAMVTAVLTAGSKTAHVAEPAGMDVFLGISRINGPGWFFVTVYPQKLLAKQAASLARSFFAIGIGSLLLELIVMAIILRRRVAVPIGQTVSATEKISQGEFSVYLDHQREDELGLLAASINRMVDSIKERDALLSRQIRELQDAQKIQQDHQRLESIGTLAGGIAHDFNNLLQGIFGYISLAKLTLDQKEKTLALLEQAEEALHMSVNLTTQLLTFSKGGKPIKKLIRLESTIENAVRFALSGSRTNYKLETASDLWPVEADAGQLAQVIQNIVLNADEAMAKSGTVTIAVNNVDIPAKTKAKLPDGGQFVRIDIKDTGAGIPEQNFPRIFDPYFTTKESGSGLGLATSYSIIKNHDGLIEVQSEIGKGSTFTIYLPASKGEEITAEPAARLVTSPKSLKVLLMDDEDIVRNVAKSMLIAIGHEVEEAADGKRAIELFRDARSVGRPFDVVILDLFVKGGMGGEETIAKIREIDPHVRAVVSSGYADIAIMADYHSYGFAAVLNKPYKLDSLQTCLSQLIG